MNQALKDVRVGFIGCGAMARALAGGLVGGGVPPERIAAADPIAAARAGFEAAVGATTEADNAAVVERSDAIVIAVKPGVVAAALCELPAGAERSRPLWISIAAGVPLSALERALASPVRVVRAMPNTPALVGAGATALCGNAAATDADLAVAEGLFEAVGAVWRAPAETHLDAVTGLSGSGPAYVFVLLEALADAAVRQGLPRDAAQLLANQTVAGAARLVQGTGEHPAALKDQVTSPGGTTIAGLERLEAAGFRAAIHAAVEAATLRSRELGAAAAGGS